MVRQMGSCRQPSNKPISNIFPNINSLIPLPINHLPPIRRRRHRHKRNFVSLPRPRSRGVGEILARDWDIWGLLARTCGSELLEHVNADGEPCVSYAWLTLTLKTHT